MKRSGLAMILVVGVLGVLGVLGSAFAVLSRIERKAAAQRVQATQAWLLARSGIEDAQARLERGQDPDSPWNRYGGEDGDLSGGDLSVEEAAEEVYRPGSPDREACPARHALRPSFPVQAATVTVEGRRRGISGRVASGTWALKVIPQAGFYVNGGDPASTSPSPLDYNANLRRMLGILAKAIDEESAPIDGSPVSEADGFNLIDLRPADARGWESWEQIKALALGGSQAKLDALRPYLALRAWVDRKVIQPNPNPPGVWAQYPVIGRSYTSLLELRMSSHWSLQRIAPFNSAPEPDFERMPLTNLLRADSAIVGRAPVHLGWARKRKPALLALLGNLRGIYLDGSYGRTHFIEENGMRIPPQIGVTLDAQLGLSWDPADECHRLADQILDCTSEIDTWEDWNLLCDALEVQVGDAAVRKAKQSILKANFNPNSDLAKFNPPPALMRNLDKSDLLAYSTELSLLPVHDHEVESVGRARASQRVARIAYSGPSVFRLDTQKEFVCENLGRLDLAGDESDIRLPGRAPFLGLSQGAGATWGHALPGLGGKGLGLQSYPEPVVDPGGGLFMRAADYDGHLRLATVETQDDDTYAVTATTADMKMLARFDDGWDLDLHDGASFENLRDATQVERSELGNGLYRYPSGYYEGWDSARGTSLFPDGSYCDYGNTPAWPDRGNANGLHGLISFWVRKWEHLFGGGSGGSFGDPTYTYYYGSRYLHWSNFGTEMPPPNMGMSVERSQAFYLGPFVDCTGIYGDGFCCFFEIGRTTSDFGTEWLMRSRGMDPRPLSWSLVTLYYDFQAPTNHRTCDLFVNNQIVGQQGTQDVYQPTWSALPAEAMDITDDDCLGPHRISLGGREEYQWENGYPLESPDAGCYYNTGADATIDELAIYDFGTDEAVAALFATNRFKEGRFYKGSAYRAVGDAPQADQAGAWFSAPISLPEGTRLLKVAWTWYRSCRELPYSGGMFEPTAGEYPEVELADAAGTGYLMPGARSTSGLGWRPSLPSWSPGVRVPSPFRLHVAFRRTAPVDANTPLLDSPILDDLTLLYRPLAQPVFSSWSEGE